MNNKFYPRSRGYKGLKIAEEMTKARLPNLDSAMKNVNIFDDRGNLNEYGKSSLATFEQEVKQHLDSAKTEQEVKIVGSLLTKLVGDLVSYKMQELMSKE